MLARNSDLYFEVRASSVAFSSTARPRLLDLPVLPLHLRVLLGELLGLLGQLLVGLLQLTLLGLQLGGELLRLHQEALGLHGGLDAVEQDPDAGGELLEEGQVQRGEMAERGELDDRLDLLLEEHGEHDEVPGPGLDQAGADGDELRRQLVQDPAAAIGGALAQQSLADVNRFTMPAGRLAGEGRDETEPRILASLATIEHSLVGIHQRRQLGQQHPPNRLEIALALQHSGDAGQVGLEPVLLGVGVGGEPKVVDHRVDVVLQLGHLTAGLDLNGAGQVALGHGGGHLGDGSHLRRQVGGEQVHVAGEVLPGAGGTGHVGLATEAALDADFAGDGGDLVGEERQGAGHVVDGLGECGHLALRVHRQLGLEVAVGDGGDDAHDAAHLLGEVRGHDVHVVGEVLPGAGHAGHGGLAAELALGAHLAATRVTSAAKALSWSTIVLMVSLSSRISPFTSTVILRDRSPRATAVVTSAMLRTWVVRLAASRFTLSVRSFQVPATPARRPDRRACRRCRPRGRRG
jgi:hypothetical protein